MNFLEFQEDLQQLIGDPTGTWITEVGGNGNGVLLKSAINYGIKQTLDRLHQNDHFKEGHYLEVDLPVNNKMVTPPDDFKHVHKIEDGMQELFEYRVVKTTNKIVFDNTIDQGIPSKVTLKYIPKQNNLEEEEDTVYFDEHYHIAVALFATERYHLAQFDVANAAQSVAYADEKMEDLINKAY